MEWIETSPGDANWQYFEQFVSEIYPKGNRRLNQSEGINTDYFFKAFVIRENGETRARAVLYNTPELNYKGKKAWCIGNFESVDDERFSKLVLVRCMNEARNHGAEYLIGPMNGSTWDNYRFSDEEPEDTFFLEICHKNYYPEQFTEAGFKPIAHYFTDITHPSQKPDLEAGREEEMRSSGMRIRNIDKEDYENELEKLYEFSTHAFSNNFLYTPISKELFFAKYREAKNIIDPGFVLIAEDENQKIIGFIFSYEDRNNTKEKSLVIKTVARDSSAKWRGLGDLMYSTMLKEAINSQYKSLIHAYMIQDGASEQISKNHKGGETMRQYTLYGIEL